MKKNSRSATKQDPHTAMNCAEVSFAMGNVETAWKSLAGVSSGIVVTDYTTAFRFVKLLKKLRGADDASTASEVIWSGACALVQRWMPVVEADERASKAQSDLEEALKRATTL